MATIQRIDTALGIYLKREMRDFHTGVRGVIIEVDYDVPSCTVQPMASTTYENGNVDEFPPIYDVPLQVIAGNNGKAKLTMPVKAGDMVGLTFSERNEDDKTDTSTHGLFPGWAITEIFPSGGGKIHPENVELWNDQVHVSMTPEGDFTLQGPIGQLKVDKTGTFSFTNGAATLEAQVGGAIMMNGAKITPDGNLITAKGVNMNDFYEYFMRHTHHYTWTDGEGQSDTQMPNS